MTCHTEGTGPDSLQASLLRELRSLLFRVFPAAMGCYHQASLAGVYTYSVPAGPAGLVDLFVMLFPCGEFAPDSPEEQQVANMSFDLCLRLLRHPKPQLRASACRKLGLLGRPEAAEALTEAARGDADEGVREAAAAALERIDVQPVPVGAFSGLDLLLLLHSPAGTTELGRASTDSRGCARFAGIPRDASCCVQVLTHEHEHDNPASDEHTPILPPVFQSIRFSHERVIDAQIGGLLVEVSPVRSEAEQCFDATLRFSASGLADTAAPAPRFRPVARQGQHLFLPSPGGNGSLVFYRLPMGQYELLWHLQPLPVRCDSRLLAESKATRVRPPISLDAYLQIVVHPADQRLLATVEQDRSGRAVLTVAGEIEALRGAKVQYDLLGETGMIELVAIPGTGTCRGVRYLRQRFAPDSALSLNLEVAG